MTLCVLLGCLPFLLGGIMNWAMMTWQDVLLPYLLIALGMLALWAAISWLMMKKLQNEKKVILGLNAPAILVLILLAVQELVLGAYWFHAVGTWTQFFFLPLLRLGFTFTSWTPSMFFAYGACLVLMLGASFVGCKMYKE